MLASSDIPALARLTKAAEEKVAADPALVRALLLGLGGTALGTGIGAHFTHQHDVEDMSRAKNTAFGAGVAAGLAGPRIVGALNSRLNPTSAAPMFAPTPAESEVAS